MTGNATAMTDTLDAEDAKLVTLARGAMARAETGSGAAVRDLDGRTYAGAPVAMAALTLTALQAAVALAIVSTKDPAHFRTTPGGYFHGMVTKAKAAQLNLDRTLWGMRRANEPKPPRTNGRAGGPRPPARSTWAPP